MENEGITPLILDHQAPGLGEWSDSRHGRFNPMEEYTVPTEQEAGWENSTRSNTNNNKTPTCKHPDLYIQ